MPISRDLPGKSLEEILSELGVGTQVPAEPKDAPLINVERELPVAGALLNIDGDDDGGEWISVPIETPTTD